MNGRAATLLMTLGASALVLSTIGAKPATHYIWNVSESVPIVDITSMAAPSVVRSVAARPFMAQSSADEARLDGANVCTAEAFH